MQLPILPLPSCVKSPSPVRAIRLRCLDCSDTRADVRDCEAVDCPLHPFRMSHRPKGTSPLKSIRAYCLWCCEGSAHEVSVCQPTDCVLRRFRFGKNPAKAGQGSIVNLKAGNSDLAGLSATAEADLVF